MAISINTKPQQHQKPEINAKPSAPDLSSNLQLGKSPQEIQPEIKEEGPDRQQPQRQPRQQAQPQPKREAKNAAAERRQDRPKRPREAMGKTLLSAGTMTIGEPQKPDVDDDLQYGDTQTKQEQSLLQQDSTEQETEKSKPLGTNELKDLRLNIAQPKRRPVPRKRDESKPVAKPVPSGSVTEDVEMPQGPKRPRKQSNIGNPSNPAISDPKPDMDVQQTPVPRPSYLNESQRRDSRIARAYKDQRKEYVPGGSLNEDLISDPYWMDDRMSVKPDEISLPTSSLMMMLRTPDSVMVPMLEELGVDPQTINEALVDDDVAEDMILDTFNKDNVVMRRVDKDPTPAESDTVVMRIRAHKGDGIWVHKLTPKMFNADADGDTIKAFLSEGEMLGAKNISNFFIGTDGEVKIDEDILSLVAWGSKIETYRNIVGDIAYLYGIETDQRRINRVAEELMNACDGGDIKGLMSAIGNVSDRSHDKAMMLYGVDKFNREIWEGMANAHIDYIYEGESADDDVVFEGDHPWNSDLSRGEMPANQMDRLIALGVNMGQVEKKNTQFRFPAADAKAIKVNDKVKIGNPIIGKTSQSLGTTVRKGDIEELIAKQMSGRMSLGERNFHVSSMVKRKIVERVGTPANYQGDIDEFMKRFAKISEAWIDIARASQFVISTDFKISDVDGMMAKAEEYDGTSKSIAGQLRRVYGDLSTKAVLGEYAPKGSEHLKFDEFCMKWRISGTTSDSFKIRNKDRAHQMAAIMYGVLDSRTKTMRKFDKDFDSAVDTMMKSKRDLTDISNSESVLNGFVSAVDLLGVETISRSGIDTFDKFMNSTIGKRILNAETNDELAGYIMSYVVEFRTRDAISFEKDGDWLSAREEWDEIASYSDTWRALVIDRMNGGNLINRIIDEAGEEYTQANGNTATFGKTAMVNQMNMAVRNLVRPKQQNYEIPYDLFYDPRSMVSGSRTLADFGKNHVLDYFKDSSNKIDACNLELNKTLEKEIRVARNMMGRPGDLLTFLDRVKNGAPLFIASDGIYADAILSQTDKTFSSSEKSLQEIATDVTYNMACMARNGRLYSDREAADDAFLGKMQIDEFLKWPEGVVRLLTDPDFEIEVYQGSRSKLLTRNSIIPDWNEESVWSYLEEHPRVAMCLRARSVQEVKENAVEYASKSLANTMMDITVNSRNIEFDMMRAKNALIDKPGFAAMARLMTPTTGRKRTSLRMPLIDNINELLNVVMEIARTSREQNEPVEDVANQFMDMIWERADLSRFDNTVHGRDAEKRGIYGVREQMEPHMRGCFARYCREIYNMGIRSEPFSMSLDMFRFEDDGSVYQYFDVVQGLSGAKTATSTSRNGMESKRTAALPFYAGVKPEDSCDGAPHEIPIDEFNVSDYERRMVQIGDELVPVSDETYEYIIESSENGVVLVYDPAECTHESGCVCPKHFVADPSTNQNVGKNTTAIARYMLDKRSIGSESGNLKVKTLGDDKTDSITKMGLFSQEKAHDTDFTVQETNIVIGTTESFFDQASYPECLFDARRYLAKKLKEANARLNYSDLSDADYQNIATSMIKVLKDESGNPSGFYVMSIGQMADIAKEALANAGKPYSSKGIRQEIENAIQSFDPYANELDVEEIMRNMTIERQTNFVSDSTKDKLMSSTERAMFEIANATHRVHGKPENAPTNKDVEGFSKVVSERMDVASVADVQNLGYKVIGTADKDGYVGLKCIGPKFAAIVGGDANLDSVSELLRIARMCDQSVFFADMNESIFDIVTKIDGAWENIVEYAPGKYMIPYFDLNVNGYDTTKQQGAVKAGVYNIRPSELINLVEDPFNSNGLTDSDAQATQGFLDRTFCYADGDYDINMSEAFSVITERNPGESLRVELVKSPEIDSAVVKALLEGKTAIIADESINPYIDRYAAAFNPNEQFGIIREAMPGDIVAWAKGICGTDEAYYPIRVFPYGYQGATPRSVEIEDVYITTDSDNALDDNASIRVRWNYYRPIMGSVFKVFEGWFAANKLMVRPEPPKNGESYRKLADGTDVDLYVNKPSTFGRRLLYLNQQLMNTVMSKARLTNGGYNFAEVSGTFPDNQEVKNALANGDMRMSDWLPYIRGGEHIEFFPKEIPNKEEMEAFMMKMLDNAVSAGINPSVVLASQYKGIMTMQWFRFNLVFDSSDTFIKCFKRWMSFMDPTLIPYSASEPSNNTLFNWDMQMLVPFATSEGEMTKEWANVYTQLGFIDEHVTGLRAKGNKPTIRYGNFSDHTAMWGGRYIPDSRIEDYVEWALADYSIDPSVIEMSIDEDEGKDLG